MSAEAPQLEFARCLTCHHRFAPLDGVCPRCSSASIEPLLVPAIAVVLASTEVRYPAAGWPSPHRLALVEVAEAVRLLAVVADGELPLSGELVAVRPGPSYFTVERTPAGKG